MVLALLYAGQAKAQSEPSTYFNVYVPPNNEAVNRNVSLIVTAVQDSTHFSIVDDDMDGDSDDNVEGLLMAGQSYVLYIKDNGINDDALYASGGVLARNGDYYIIESDKLVYASMSTDSDWQHDFVPSVNKKSVGQKFFVYAPKVSSSPRDLNVFAYSPGTTVSVYKVHSVPTTQTGYTNVELAQRQLVIQRTLDPGQDLIHHFTDGRDVMESGGTYLIESNRDISVQYGALWGNARDGGGYVPASNGSGAGELFYFAVPYQSNGEQEIRIVSWDPANTVSLARYANGAWTDMREWELGALQPAEWVGKEDGNASYPTVFRVRCTPGKRVSVMEANWMETGSTNTSDMSTMLSSEAGTSSGKRFLAYMLPPSRQNNVVNPFTGEPFTGSISHFYLFAGDKSTTVTVKDAKTNGQVLNRTYEIAAGRYADAFFTLEEWQSIYNGTGNPSGPDRPYVIIEASEHIAVLSTNFNDNWMNYFGSSLPQSFVQSGGSSQLQAKPGDEVVFSSVLAPSAGDIVTDAELEVSISPGLVPVHCKLFNKDEEVEEGEVVYTENGSSVTFHNLETILPDDEYTVETKVTVAANFNDGRPVPNETVLSVETAFSGKVDGQEQQSILAQGLQNNAENTSGLIFSACQAGTISDGSNDSWNASWVDYDADGWEDLFVVTKDPKARNELYRNNADGTFSKITDNAIVQAQGTTVAAVWADINNNGLPDVLLVNATEHRTMLYLNEGNGQFSLAPNSGIELHPQYFHGAAFADFDNDGFVDLIATNFFQTRFHHLYRNNGDNTFSRVSNTPVTAVSERAMAPVLADYDNDGLVDIFIPNGAGRPNSLFRNLGSFQFEQPLGSGLTSDAGNSVGAAWGDYDNDGFLDLIVLNASGETDVLYRNNGNGSFQPVADAGLSKKGGHSHGAAWLDVDNDGFLDLYITDDEGSSFLYRNDGNGGFAQDRVELVSGQIGKAYGLAAADYDKDGYMDMAVMTHTEGPARFFCNNGNASNWIGFKLRGQYSNRMAIGARVSIKAEGQWQQREFLPVSGFGSQQSAFIHFGLGGGATVDSVLIHWPSGVRQRVSSFAINAYNLILEEGGNLLTGTAFNDVNGNGLQDEGEPLVPHLPISTHNGRTRTSTDKDGRFALRTTAQALALEVLNPNWQLSPGYSGYSFADGKDSLHAALPLIAVIDGYDLSVSFATTAWRRGFTSETVLLVENRGTNEANGAVLNLRLPEHAYVIAADKPYAQGGEQDYAWALGKIEPGQAVAVGVLDSIGLEAVTGQVLQVQASVSAVGQDLNINNNSVLEEVEIVGAIDPNDILVSPLGDGPEGFISPTQWLTYTIRFENVGTYEATYVFLENALPSELDWSTFEVVSSSHTYTYDLSPKGQLSVSYRHIGLPPAEQDSIGAHGYFKYRILPKQALKGGEQIRNRAEITFDFEAPIVTNTVLNSIKYRGGSEVKKLTVSPNPASGQIAVTLDPDFFKVLEPPLITRWQLFDSQGRQIRQGTGYYEPQLMLDVSSLTTGLYFIRAYDGHGDVYAGRLVKK